VKQILRPFSAFENSSSSLFRLAGGRLWYLPELRIEQYTRHACGREMVHLRNLVALLTEEPFERVPRCSRNVNRRTHALDRPVVRSAANALEHRERLFGEAATGNAWRGARVVPAMSLGFDDLTIAMINEGFAQSELET
jgi:hypothetical protein